MRVWFLFFSLILLASGSWGDGPSLTPTDSRTPKEKKEWAAHLRELKAAGAQLGTDGKLNIFGYDLKAKNVTDFGIEGDEIKEAQKDPADFATGHVDLTTSPDGRWTVIHLDNNMLNDFWIYDHRSKQKPEYIEASFGRFNFVYWMGNHLFRVLEGCSMICSQTQFFKPGDVQHPSPEIGDFFDYLPERNLYIADYDDGLEVGHPFGPQKPQRFFVEKGFLNYYEGLDSGNSDNVNMLPDNSDRDLKVVLKGEKLTLDYKTEGGKKVHKEFVLGKF